jgi:hypothetical protein
MRAIVRIIFALLVLTFLSLAVAFGDGDDTASTSGPAPDTIVNTTVMGLMYSPGLDAIYTTPTLNIPEF